MQSKLGRIGIIGTGRVARALAFGLAPHSDGPLLLWGRTAARLDAAIAGLPDPAEAAPTLAELVGACDTIAIAVADDALREIIGEAARVAVLNRASLVFHVSGGSGAAILAPLEGAGALTAAIHPAMTFTGDPALEVSRMRGACFAVTGSGEQARTRALAVVDGLGGQAVDIAEDKRVLYHAALCHAANHLVTLMFGVFNALEEAGVGDPAGLVAPLVRAALENSLARGFDALSGPALRGDAAMVRAHLTALDQQCPQMRPAYLAMARATLDALDQRDGPSHRAALHDVLAG